MGNGGGGGGEDTAATVWVGEDPFASLRTGAAATRCLSPLIGRRYSALNRMLLRILTALVLIPPVIYVIGWGPEWLYLLVLVAVVERGLYEYFIISRHAGFRTFDAVGYVAAPLLCLAPAAHVPVPEARTLALGFLILIAVLGLALFAASDLKQYLGSASSTLLGILYVGGTLSVMVPLRFPGPAPTSSLGPPLGQPATRLGPGRELTLFLLLVVTLGDILAYFTGRLAGRTPLFPRVSPKKTVEGACGGLAGSLLGAWGFARWFWHPADLKAVMLIAAFVAVAGQFGDLVESALKRGAELKDSGRLLPGHGGLLDRIDSLIFGAPALWLALMFLHIWRP